MNSLEREWIMELARRDNLKPWLRRFADDLVRRAFEPRPRPLSERQRIVLMKAIGVRSRERTT